MSKRIFLVSLLLLFVTIPAFGIDWQTNPVFLRGVKDNSIYSSYRATFGSGNLHNRSHSLGVVPYVSFLSADRDIYNHGFYHGFVRLLSSDRNFGVFSSNGLGITWTDGVYTQNNFDALTTHYIDDYNSKSINRIHNLDFVYTKKLSDKVALGGALNFYYSHFKDDTSYDTISTDVASGPRNNDYTDKMNKFYFGATFGMAWIPIKNLELDFALEAGGFFGTRGYEEHLLGNSAPGETYDYDHKGDYDGLGIRFEIDGLYRISDNFKIPFSISYVYSAEWDDYNGFGIYDTPVMAPTVYYKDYENSLKSNSVKLGAGLNYYPTGKPSDLGIYLWSYYNYYNGRTDTDSLTDETFAGFNAAQSITDTEYNNHTLGLSIGINFPLTEKLRLSTGLNYFYTFINMDNKNVTYRNGIPFSSYNYSGDGYSQNLGAKIGLSYTAIDDRLKINLISTIPIYIKSNYDIAGNISSPSILQSGPITSSSKRMDYSLILSISYSF